MTYITNDNAVIAAVSLLKLNSVSINLYLKFSSSSLDQPPSGPIAKLLIFLELLVNFSPEISKHVSTKSKST